MAGSTTPFDVPLSKREIQGFYGQAAPVYDEHSAQHEDIPKAMALDAIARRPGEDYLEVAVGTGASLLKQIELSGPDNVVGVDMTPEMLSTARGKLGEAGATSVPLMLADARHLPFADASFDCLFNSYMLDLIPTSDLGQVVGEYRRVLRPGGRIVLVGLTESEGHPEDETFIQGWKDRYRNDAMSCGGCRPLLVGSWVGAAGFEGMERIYSGEGASWPSEIVTARVPRD